MLEIAKLAVVVELAATSGFQLYTTVVEPIVDEMFELTVTPDASNQSHAVGCVSQSAPFAYSILARRLVAVVDGVRRTFTFTWSTPFTKNGIVVVAVAVVI